MRSSTVLHFFAVDGPEECLESCIDLQPCNYFTHYEDPNGDLCYAFLDCPTLSASGCSNCVSGERDCDRYECFEQGKVLGTFIDGPHVDNADDCLDACIGEPDCAWFTFDKSTSICTLTKDNVLQDPSCLTCVFGQMECSPREQLSKMLVTAGKDVALGTNASRQAAEYVDLAAIDTVCAQPQQYPLALFGAVALRKAVTGEPLVCGGGDWDFLYVTDECFSFQPTLNSWNSEVGMSLPRFHAASVDIGNGNYWISGGRSIGGLIQDSTEIYNENGLFEVGPSLPEPMADHSVVALNATHVFVGTKSRLSM